MICNAYKCKYMCLHDRLSVGVEILVISIGIKSFNVDVNGEQKICVAKI